MLDDFVGLYLGRLEQEAAGNSPIVLDRFQQLLFVFLPHARQDAYLALTGELLYTLKIADLVRTPNQRDRLGAEPLHFEELEHGWAILLQQIGMKRQLALAKHLLEVEEHTLANSWNGKHLLLVGHQICDLLWPTLDRFPCISVGADTER